MTSAWLHLDPAFVVAPVIPTDLRLVRRAHGPVRLHRHLRARPPHRRRRRLPRRRARADPRAGRLVGALPRRQLRLRLPLGGRHRPGRRPAGPPRPGLAHAWRPTRSASTSSCAGPSKAGVEVMYALNLGTRGRRRRRWTRTSTSTTPTGTALSDLRRSERRRGALRRHACSASATRWTAPGRPATRPPTSTAAWPPRRPAPCAAPTPASSSSPAAAPARRCRRSAPGSRGPRAGLRPGRPHLRARLLRGDRRRPRQLPRLRRSTWTTSSTASWPRPTAWAPG